MTSRAWLKSPRWDLGVLIGSVLMTLLPYATYLIVGGGVLDDATVKGTPAYDARVFVNQLVVIAVGGPHMYATFTRTLMSETFARHRVWFALSAIAIPVFVFAAGTASYESYVWLLTIFYALASFHALHQVVWLADGYARRAGRAMPILERVIDYGVVFSSLYPFAVLKMATGRFTIGPVVLKYGELVGGSRIVVHIAFVVFFTFLVAFIVKTIREQLRGTLVLPKTILILVTAVFMFVLPALPNLDTAFQGINTFHSFQYLALTWFVLRQGPEVPWFFRLWDRAEERLPLLRLVDRGSRFVPFYLVCLALLPISTLLIAFASSRFARVHGDLPGADEAPRYLGVLSILLVHYAHDIFVFADRGAVFGPVSKLTSSASSSLRTQGSSGVAFLSVGPFASRPSRRTRDRRA